MCWGKYYKFFQISFGITIIDVHMISKNQNKLCGTECVKGIVYNSIQRTNKLLKIVTILVIMDISVPKS